MKKYIFILLCSFSFFINAQTATKNLELIDIITIGGALPQVGTSGYSSSISDTTTLVVPANQYWVIVEATTTFHTQDVGFSMSSGGGVPQGMWILGGPKLLGLENGNASFYTYRPIYKSSGGENSSSQKYEIVPFHLSSERRVRFTSGTYNIIHSYSSYLGNNNFNFNANYRLIIEKYSLQ